MTTNARHTTHLLGIPRDALLALQQRLGLLAMNSTCWQTWPPKLALLISWRRGGSQFNTHHSLSGVFRSVAAASGSLANG
jgi:hypothetical protein